MVSGTFSSAFLLKLLLAFVVLPLPFGVESVLEQAS